MVPFIHDKDCRELAPKSIYDINRDRLQFPGSAGTLAGSSPTYAASDRKVSRRQAVQLFHRRDAAILRDGQRIPQNDGADCAWGGNRPVDIVFGRAGCANQGGVTTALGRSN